MSYSDLLDTLADSVCIHQLVLKALGCSYNCRRLAYYSFQLTHISREDHAVELIEPWRPRQRQNIITALTTLPQGWISACKHQCTTAITTIWTKSLWAFPESYTVDDSWIVCSNLCSPFLWAVWLFIYFTLINWLFTLCGTIFPFQGCNYIMRHNFSPNRSVI